MAVPSFIFTQSFINNLRRVVIQNMNYDVFWWIPLTSNVPFLSAKVLSKSIVFNHLGSINWGKMIGLLESALNVELFHRLEWMVSAVGGVLQKAKVEPCAFDNFMSACFGTTKPDFNELKQGNGLLLEMNNKTSWRKRFRGLGFWITQVLCRNN